MRNYRNRPREVYPVVIPLAFVRVDPFIDRVAWARTITDAQLASAEARLREVIADSRRYFELWQSAMARQAPVVGKDV